MRTILMRHVAIVLILTSLLFANLNQHAAAESPAFAVHTTLSNPAPYMLMTEVLGVNVSRDPNGVLPIAGAEVCVVWHFGADPADPECNTTDTQGNVPFFRTVEEMQPGQAVQIEVTVDIGEGPEAVAPLVITPR